MYAQWRTIEDYEAMREIPTPAPYLREALTFAEFEPGIYDAVESYEGSREHGTVLSARLDPENVTRVSPLLTRTCAERNRRSLSTPTISTTARTRAGLTLRATEAPVCRFRARDGMKCSIRIDPPAAARPRRRKGISRGRFALDGPGYDTELPAAAHYSRNGRGNIVGICTTML